MSLLTQSMIETLIQLIFSLNVIHSTSIQRTGGVSLTHNEGTSNQPCPIDIGPQRFEIGHDFPALTPGEYSVKVQAHNGAGKRIMCINAKTQLVA